MYSLRKLTTVQHEQLIGALKEMFQLCGAPLEDMDLPDGLLVVLVKGLSCSDPTKKLYFSVGHEAICYFRGTDQESIAQETDIYYPLCSACSSMEKLGVWKIAVSLQSDSDGTTKLVQPRSI